MVEYMKARKAKKAMKEFGNHSAFQSPKRNSFPCFFLSYIVKYIVLRKQYIEYYSLIYTMSQP